MARRRDVQRTNERALVDIPEEAAIRITNDYNGRYVLAHPALVQMKIELSKAGSGASSEEWITFKELRVVRNAHAKAFETLMLLITGVKDATKKVSYETEDGKKKTKTVPVEVKDVIQALGLASYYENHARHIPIKNELGILDGYDIEDFILESDLFQFEKVMKEAPASLRFKIIDSAIGLYKTNDFSNKAKINIIEDISGVGYFDAVDYAKAYKGGIIEKMGRDLW